MTQQEYTVRLDQFEGPLDLLLHLIREAELDVSAISIAHITDQYLRYLESLQRVDVETAGEFLVLAATLVEIKSRTISPAPPPEEGERGAFGSRAAREETDPAAELVRQLLEYKAYRDAADALDRRRHEWDRRYPASRAGWAQPEPEESAEADAAPVDVEDLSLVDLVQAFRRIIETVQFDRLGAHQVRFDDTPIELHAADLLDRLRRDTAAAPEQGLQFRSIFEGRTKSEAIGLFLALLELVRQHAVRFTQDRPGGEVTLYLEHRDEVHADAGAPIDNVADERDDEPSARAEGDS